MFKWPWKKAEPAPIIESAVEEGWGQSLDCLALASHHYFARADALGVGTLRVNSDEVPRADILEAIKSGGIEPCASPFNWINPEQSTYPTEGGMLAIFSHAGGPAMFLNTRAAAKNYEDMTVDAPEVELSPEVSDQFTKACFDIFHDPNYRLFLKGLQSDWQAPAFVAVGVPAHTIADLQNTILNVANTLRVVEEKHGQVQGVILNMTIPVYILDEVIKIIHSTFPHLQGNVHIILGSGFWRRNLA